MYFRGDGASHEIASLYRDLRRKANARWLIDLAKQHHGTLQRLLRPNRSINTITSSSPVVAVSTPGTKYKGQKI